MVAGTSNIGSNTLFEIGLWKWVPKLRTGFQTHLENDLRNGRWCFGRVFGNAVRHGLSKWALARRTGHRYFEQVFKTFRT